MARNSDTAHANTLLGFGTNHLGAYLLSRPAHAHGLRGEYKGGGASLLVGDINRTQTKPATIWGMQDLVMVQYCGGQGEVYTSCNWWLTWRQTGR